MKVISLIKRRFTPSKPQTEGIYHADETPPFGILFFTSLQHMLLVLSLGMTLPIVVARSANLDLTESSSMLAVSLLTMGVATILQTRCGRFLGCGYQAFSTGESAAIAVCILAVDVGGIPLVIGMTLFSGILRIILGSFTSKIRKMFSPEVTGTLIFILGLNLVPTGFKHFLGSSVSGTYDPSHIIISLATLLFMLVCSLLIKKLKPYAALLGICFGFVFSALLGYFDTGSMQNLTNSVVALPVYANIGFSFDLRVMIAFGIVTITSVVDNIGDFSACQRADDPKRKKIDWRSIENGIRALGVSTALCAFIGGPMLATATTNVGISAAGKVTSRKVAYLAGAMLIVISFVPGLTGILSLIPEPVLGAVLLYSMCYIMSGGFQSIASCALDDRKIFTIFLSIGFAASTLVPDLYSFLPEEAEIIASPMIMGVGVLLITTLLTRIGQKKKYTFQTGVTAAEIDVLNTEIERVCRTWGTDREVLRAMQVSLDALCEGIFELDPAAKIHADIVYDNLQLKLSIQSENSKLSEDANENSSFGIAVHLVKKIFDDTDVKFNNGDVSIRLCTDL